MAKKKIDHTKYRGFVDAVTSDESKDFLALTDRLMSLDRSGANIERLMTGAVGINSEGGEIMESVKKLVFQGKPWDEETKFHIKRELGDVMWYLTQCLIAMDLSLDDVIAENIKKLEARYPGGQFDAWYSEHRQEGDL